MQACPAHLNESQLEQWQRDGYLAFADVLSPGEVIAAREGLSTLIHSLVSQTDITKNGAFWTRPGERFGVQFEPGYTPHGELSQGDPSHGDSSQSDEPDVELKVRKLMWYADQHPHFAYLSGAHPRIGGVLESLLGPGYSMFQDMALIKPPFIGSEKPWHQDNAYFSVTPLDAIVGVWIALDDATIENGCMHVIRGGHKMGAMKHFHGSDCEIMAGRLNPKDAIPVEIPAGGAMFFYGMLPHQTPPNASPDRRRAIQFHYRSAHSRIVPRDEYDTIYAEADGTPASCAAAS